MKSISLLAGAGLASFFVFLIVSIPAKVLTDLATPEGVQLAGVSGSAWRGEALSVQVPGFRLGRTSWIVRPAALILGRLSATIKTEWPGGRASGELTASITGTIRLSNVDAASPVAPIAQQMNLPPSGGQLLISFAELELVDQWPQTAVGEIRVENVPLALMGVPSSPTGSYQISFATEDVTDDGIVVGELTDLDGPLQISGNVTLSPPNNYEVFGRVNARSDAPSDLVQALVILGPAGADGTREFSLAGSL
jgi:general secretion pathway protein N